MMNVYNNLKQIAYRRLVPFLRLIKYVRWKIYLATSPQINLVVGSGGTKFSGWFDTDIDTLDVTKEQDFIKYFSKRKIDKILAEHVLEHLTNTELELIVQNFYKYSSAEINIRIAVPDGNHNEEKYIDCVVPGGSGVGAADHKNLFTYKTLGKLFEKHGFKSIPIEYWDENKKFLQGYKNDSNGYIFRSMLNDERNRDGKPNYTSLIMDFIK